MEDEFPGPEYSHGEDLTGSCVLPLSYTYTPFSIEIPNNYSNVTHACSLHHPHVTSEDERACPSVWDDDFNTHSFSCPLCCDPSSSHLSQCAPVCYSDGLLLQSGPHQLPSYTTASHTWTPGGAVQYHTSSAEVCAAVASLSSEDEQISSHKWSGQHEQVQTTFCAVPPDIGTITQLKDSIRSFSEKSKKPCHCTKSQCLKLYCDCFASGEICSECSCVNCCNNMEHVTARYRAIKTCLNKNPDAFRSKVNSSVQGDVKGSQTRSCNCKSSGCLKNYCECYKAKIMCSSMCKCVNCSNYSRSEVKGSAVEKSSQPDCSSTHHTTKSSVSCITDAVVEATCGCLLAQAEEVEKERDSRVQAERATLEEFGHCLTQILRFMFKHTHTHKSGLELQSFLTVGIYRTGSPGVPDGDKNRRHSWTHHTLLRLTGATYMMPRVQVLWTCSVLIVILFMESHCIQKTTLTKNWGPQSMLYLKGKYGRRYIPDSDADFYKSALNRLYAVIRDFEKMKSAQAGRSTRLITAENLLIRYTE